MIVTGGWLWANTDEAPGSQRNAVRQEKSTLLSADAPTETTAVPGDIDVGGGGACAADTEENLRLRFEHAAVIFVGIARSGPDGAIRHGPNAGEELYSPARFEVIEYVKGSGPDELLVETATKKLDEKRNVTGSDGLDAREGEGWLVYGFDHGQFEETGVYRADGCSSTRLSSGDDPDASATPERAVAGTGACAADTEENLRLRFEHATVIFVGTAGLGPDGTVRHGPNAGEELYSPARFKVIEYVKGSGPDELLLETATKKLDEKRNVTGSDGLDAQEDDRWLVYGYDHGQFEETGVYRADGCSSTLLSASP